MTSLYELDQLPLQVKSNLKIAKGLKKLGVERVLDLLTYYPRKYLDRTNITTIAQLELGAEGGFVGSVENINVRFMRNRRQMIEARFCDATGTISVTFFNQAWREAQLKNAKGPAIVFGKVDSYRGRKQMINPVVDFIGDRTDKIVAVYPQSETHGVVTADVSKQIDLVLNKYKDIENGIVTMVEAEIVGRKFVTRKTAFNSIHRPQSRADIAKARDRLAFDELLRVQLVLERRKFERAKNAKGIRHSVGGSLVGSFTKNLPFPLTGAQKRAFAAICSDLSSEFPMHRLLQGDVGAGKTIIAVLSALVALDGGFQVAIMAPTEVLAEQHCLALRQLLHSVEVKDSSSLLGSRPISIELFAARRSASEKRQIKKSLSSGELEIAVGTHALLSEGIEFANLGLVVVDEQHRFGVNQRETLRSKGVDADLLIMTATPIPRTAALTLYGDLDITTLDELPPGRKSIKTRWASTEDQLVSTWEFVVKQVRKGHQAYVVCSKIDNADDSAFEEDPIETLEIDSDVSDKRELASVIQLQASLSEGPLTHLKVAALHGRMTSAEKQLIMDEFRSGKINVLVATTVIEVGVDVPNASVMVICDADRFGIAQLHQLRGRVGRGSAESWCILVSPAEVNDVAAQRLSAMVNSTDGFELAQLDLELRGEGRLFGQAQSGRSDLRLASILRDGPLIEVAQRCAQNLYGRINDPLVMNAINEEIAILAPRVDNIQGVFQS